jgi:hypothetical protein
MRTAFFRAILVPPGPWTPWTEPEKVALDHEHR